MNFNVDSFDENCIHSKLKEAFNLSNHDFNYEKLLHLNEVKHDVEPIMDLPVSSKNQSTNSMCSFNIGHKEEQKEVSKNSMHLSKINQKMELLPDNDSPTIAIHAPIRCQGWLLRLFESKLFDITIAIQYLFNSKEPGVLTYLGNRLFQFDNQSVDFYLPQLINLYINIWEVAEVLHPYIVQRCRASVDFSLKCLWLLEAYGIDMYKRSTRKLQGCHLKNTILAEDLRMTDKCVGSRLSVGFKTTHQRSQSDAIVYHHDSGLKRTVSNTNTARLFVSGNLSSGRAFDPDCCCLSDGGKMRQKTQCFCSTFPRLRVELDFISSLMAIGNNLSSLESKEHKSSRLISELTLLNLNLPARVWMPLYSDNSQQQQHVVLRIPHSAGCVLNSKDKAPYCLFVEVVLMADGDDTQVPRKLCDNHLSRSDENLTDNAPISTGNGSIHFPIQSKAISSDNVFFEEHRPETGKPLSLDTLSVQSLDSTTSDLSCIVMAADIRRRLDTSTDTNGSQLRHRTDDPSAWALSEPWERKIARLKAASPYGQMDGWNLLPVIVKTGDDLRQELLAFQLLSILQTIWSEERVPLYLRPYKIVVVSSHSGLMEPIVNACSLHQIKQNISNNGNSSSLLDYFLSTFGTVNSEQFLAARENFVQSCAGYSLACYFLQVKDRHNGNILLDSDGHLIHIDFGFILSNSPKNLAFETSPFKLTQELIDVMGGNESDMFEYFKILMLRGLIAARKHHERIVNIIEIMLTGSQLPCFRDGATTVRSLRDRFHMNCTDEQLHRLIDSMVERSRDSLTTRLYDNFQYFTNGIL